MLKLEIKKKKFQKMLDRLCNIPLEFEKAQLAFLKSKEAAEMFKKALSKFRWK